MEQVLGRKAISLARHIEWERYLLALEETPTEIRLEGTKCRIYVVYYWIISIPRRLHVPVRNLRRRLHVLDTKLLMIVGAAAMANKTFTVAIDPFFNSPDLHILGETVHIILTVGEVFAVFFLFVSVMNKILAIWTKTR